MTLIDLLNIDLNLVNVKEIIIFTRHSALLFRGLIHNTPEIYFECEVAHYWAEFCVPFGCDKLYVSLKEECQVKQYKKTLRDFLIINYDILNSTTITLYNYSNKCYSKEFPSYSIPFEILNREILIAGGKHYYGHGFKEMHILLMNE